MQGDHRRQAERRRTPGDGRRWRSCALVAVLVAGVWACSDAGREPSGTTPPENAPETAAVAPEPEAPPEPEAVAPVASAEAGQEEPPPAAVPRAPAPAPPQVPSEAPTTVAAEAAPGGGTGEAPLDLDGLAERLKASKAIGVFTKLKLKNEFDDLLDALKAHHAGRNGPSLSELRQSYDLLVMKMLAVFDDREPDLSRDLLASREAVWMRLNDPAVLAGS